MRNEQVDPWLFANIGGVATPLGGGFGFADDHRIGHRIFALRLAENL
jgi:hypothetical protein